MSNEEVKDEAKKWEQFLDERKRKMRREKSKAKIDYLRNEYPDIKNKSLDLTNTHRNILKQWLILLVVALASFGIVLEVIFFWLLPTLNLASSQIESIANSIFDPTITIAGLVIGFFPVIGFFCLTEMKEDQTMTEQEIEGLIDKVAEFKDLEKPTDLKSAEEDFIFLNKINGFFSDFYENLRTEFLNYIAVYLVIAILALFSLPILYLFLSPIFFITVDMLLLVTILTGIFLVIHLALMRKLGRAKRPKK